MELGVLLTFLIQVFIYSGENIGSFNFTSKDIFEKLETGAITFDLSIEKTACLILFKRAATFSLSSSISLFFQQLSFQD